MENEVNNLLNNNHQVEIEEKKPLQDLDLSHLIIIKNPNNEVAIGKLLLNLIKVIVPIRSYKIH